MRRRILRSTLLVVAATALLLGLPLLLVTRALVEDITRADMVARLDRVAVDVVDQEGGDGRVDLPLDTRRIELAVPSEARLDITYPGASGSLATSSVGAPEVSEPLAEELDLGQGGRLLLLVPGDGVRNTQLQATAAVALVVALSVAGGALVSTLTARRLAGPLQDVAGRAAKLGAGDFRAVPRRHGIPELDRVSEVLDSSASDLANLVQRERELVGDLSHQLRSRLTAVRLRLDELAEHPDRAVVEEAGEAMAQVDRLADAVDEMVRVSRRVRTSGTTPVDVAAELTTVVEEWRPLYDQSGRPLQLDAEPGVLALATPVRLREAVAVLVENALVHGGGPVTVTVTEGDQGVGGRAPTVLVEVADSGDGVPEELVGRVFDRGFSGGDSSGVGLALARTLVETDGGRLELRRARPALFTVFLTAAAEPAPPPAVSEPR